MPSHGGGISLYVDYTANIPGNRVIQGRNGRREKGREGERSGGKEGIGKREGERKGVSEDITKGWME